MRARADQSSRLGSERSEWPTPQGSITINNLCSDLPVAPPSFCQAMSEARFSLRPSKLLSCTFQQIHPMLADPLLPPSSLPRRSLPHIEPSCPPTVTLAVLPHGSLQVTDFGAMGQSMGIRYCLLNN